MSFGIYLLLITWDENSKELNSNLINIIAGINLVAVLVHYKDAAVLTLEIEVAAVVRLVVNLAMMKKEEMQADSSV